MQKVIDLVVKISTHAFMDAFMEKTDTPSAAGAKALGKITVHTGLSQVSRLRQMPAHQGADLTSSCARLAGPWLS